MFSRELSILNCNGTPDNLTVLLLCVTLVAHMCDSNDTKTERKHSEMNDILQVEPSGLLFLFYNIRLVILTSKYNLHSFK